MTYTTAKKILSLAALSVLAGSALVSCSSNTEAPAGAGDTEPTQINYAWWGDDDRAKKTQAAIDLFESANPNITVNVTFAAFDAYNQKLATQLAGGGAPDVFMVDKSYFREYADRGVLTDLSTLEIDTTDISDSYLTAGKIGDATFGIAPGGTTQVMAYNADVWAAAGLADPTEGTTWSEIAKAASAIKSASDGKAVVLSDPGKYTDWFAAWLQQNGKDLYGADGSLAATEKDIAAFWKFTTGLVESGVVTDAQTSAAIDGTAANSGLVSGASTAEFTPLSALAGFTSATTAALKAAPLPTDTDNTGMAAQPSQMFAVAATSKKKEAAATFIEFMLNDVEAGKALGVTRGVPTNQKVLEAITPTLSEYDAQIAGYMTSYAALMQGRVWAEPTGASAAKAEFARIYEDLSFKRTSLEDAAAQMYEFFTANVGK